MVCAMKILEHIDLQPYNTFKISCVARYFVVVESAEDVIELSKTDIYKDNKKLFLGGGSNILLTQETYDGLVIKNEIRWKKVIEETTASITVKIWAGENRDTIVQRAVSQGYTGVENLVSIPGTVWAAPMQNIWAYGVEIKDLVHNVMGIDLPSQTEIILASYECEFGYRESIFKHSLKDKFFITHVTFVFGKYDPKTYFPIISYGAIQDKLAEIADGDDLAVTPELIASAVAQIRESKLPNRKEIGTAGSFFKNPTVTKEKYKQLQSIEPSITWYPEPAIPSPSDDEGGTVGRGLGWGWLIKLNAWQLIDLAGLKGLQHGNVGTYHKHALILINQSNGTGAEIVQLASRIQKIVRETFGVEIVPEVNYID